MSDSPINTCKFISLDSDVIVTKFEEQINNKFKEIFSEYHPDINILKLNFDNFSITFYQKYEWEGNGYFDTAVFSNGTILYCGEGFSLSESWVHLDKKYTKLALHFDFRTFFLDLPPLTSYEFHNPSA